MEEKKRRRGGIYFVPCNTTASSISFEIQDQDGFRKHHRLTRKEIITGTMRTSIVRGTVDSTCKSKMFQMWKSIGTKM